MRILCVLLAILTILGACKIPDKHAPVSRKAGLSLDSPRVPISRYEYIQDKLDTQKDFHHIVLKPNFFRLQFPGYLVGIEKVKKSVVGAVKMGMCSDASVPCIQTRGDKYDGNTHISLWLESRFWGGLGVMHDHKTMIPTHVVKSDTDSNSMEFTYNIYGTQNGNKPIANPKHYKELLKQGWDHLKSLKADIHEQINQKQITHVIFLSMGWNTAQWEALANFNDIYTNIMTKAEKDKYYPKKFNPLVIALTWPSFWTRKAEPLEDYPNKSVDADEIGITLANLLIQDVIGEINKEQERDGEKPVSIVLIGHSLGARLLTRAADSGYLLKKEPAKIDIVFGLEGAFSARRFLDPFDGPYHFAFRDQVKNSFYSSSVYDRANVAPTTLLKKYYVGSDETIKAIKDHSIIRYSKQHYDGRWELPKDVFKLLSVDKNGNFAQDIKANDGKIALVDVSSITNENVPGTGGGAHSDIYSLETGAYLWQAIRACTIDKEQH